MASCQGDEQAPQATQPQPPPRPTACTECHSAKVKCDKSFPCARCVRLSKQCIPHVSKQGRGRKRRRTKKDGSGAASTEENDENDQPQMIEDALSVSSASFRPNHFGLKHLIRSWVSFAFRRRSFSLLAKASTLAARVGITMDSIFCGEDEASSMSMPTSMVGERERPMSFLVPALLIPARHQQVGSSSHLRWSEVPLDLLTATGCIAVGENLEDHVLSSILGNRWIFVRELKEGMSRYFVSPAFEQDIAAWSMIQAIWASNEREVVSIFLTPDGKAAHLRGLMHQFSLYSSPDVAVRPCRYATKIRVKDRNAMVPPSFNSCPTVMINVDCVMCMKIVDIDHAFLYLEYLREEVSPASVLASLSTTRPSPPLVSSSAMPNQAEASMPSMVTNQNPPQQWLNLDTANDLREMNELLELLRQGP